MNLSPWTIYWIMQCDSIKAALCAMMVVYAAASFCTMWLTLAASMEEKLRADCSTFSKWAKKSISVFVALLIINSVFPSTKTMAAAYIIPKIANNEAIGAEAKEIYELAKQAMVDLVDVKPDGAE